MKHLQAVLHRAVGPIRFGCSLAEVKSLLPPPAIKLVGGGNRYAFPAQLLKVAFSRSDECECIEGIQGSGLLMDTGMDPFAVSGSELVDWLRKRDPLARVASGSVISEALGIAVYHPEMDSEGLDAEARARRAGVAFFRPGYYSES